jgi:L-rhamnonate dehydratase
MKITDVKVFELIGRRTPQLALFEPVSGIGGHAGWPGSPSGTIRRKYVQIETNEGLNGLSATLTDTAALYFVKHILTDILIDEDPLAIEALWEKMYQKLVHNRKGSGMIAISLLDIALWDICGKYRQESVFRLLGGPTRNTVRAYAAMLGFDTHSASVAKRSIEMVERGFTAMKWYFSYSDQHGSQGLNANVEMVKAYRDAVGYDIDLMLDFRRVMMNTSLRYALKLVKRIERYEPFWLEEPFPPDDIESYAALAKVTDIPIAGMEHEYTRWGFKSLIEKGAAQILQPDTSWAGGITEMRKICALASAFGRWVVPHSNEDVPVNIQLLFAQQPRTCPLQEFNPKLNAANQYFFKTKVQPEKGYFTIPNGPGFGIELDQTKIVKIENI